MKTYDTLCMFFYMIFEPDKDDIFHNTNTLHTHLSSRSHCKVVDLKTIKIF